MNKKVGIVTAVVAAVLVTYVVVDQVSRWHQTRIDEVVEQEKEKWEEDVTALKQEVATLREESAELREEAGESAALWEGEEGEETLSGGDPVASGEELAVYGENRKAIKRVRKKDPCVTSRAILDAFFRDLDGKRYLEAYGQKGNARDFFIGVMKDLSGRTPYVADERATPLRLMRNMSHFYRVMGRDRVMLMAHILKNEPRSLEKALHAWYTLAFEEGRCPADDIYRPTKEAVYGYASFFLHTFGGKSYLVRRDSRLRILASYYSVLVMDRANREKMNQYGIDIRPHLELLENDLRNYRGLAMRKHYLRTISALDKTYL